MEFHEEVGSTNDRARELALSGAPVPALVVANRQTAGRGRHGRPWSSNHPGGLWMSLTDEGGAFAPLLPLIAGAAVLRGVEACLERARQPALSLKWPNDVYLRGQKLAGILCESAHGAVVVGIGVNVNQGPEDLPTDGDVPPVSLRMLRGSATDKGQVLEAILTAWRQLREELESGRRPGDPARVPETLLRELNERSAVYGAAVAVQGTARHSNGRLGPMEDDSATGGPIQGDGALVIRTRGRTVEMIAGSVRILGGR
ncbi:MAG: biotin--[acetyl-CoA-carboxylase] ligase [Gemmatimonadetes bacterium]|nr:biotin--[acetyl-CoA-carboxylase] ligase [Gemmatimonadota bacterium]